MSSENYLTKQIREALAMQPDVWVFRNQVAKMQHIADGRIEQVGAGLGSADLLGCVGSTMTWWEVKPPKRRHTDKEVIARQIAWQSMMRRKGIPGGEVTSIEEAMRIVQIVRNGTRPSTLGAWTFDSEGLLLGWVSASS